MRALYVRLIVLTAVCLVAGLSQWVSLNNKTSDLFEENRLLSSENRHLRLVTKGGTFQMRESAK
jgi:regulator of replication initiation timing